MFSWTQRLATKRCAGVTLAVVVLLVSLEAMPAPCLGSEPGTIKSGPFIDKIIFRVITGSDEQVLALLNNEIDAIGDSVSPTCLPDLMEAEDIEVTETLMNSYGYVAINTARYPFNITGFRRAVAFAVDKERISREVWDGLSVPLDSVIPRANPFSIEGNLPYTYYEANVPLGNQLLDGMGFLDTDSDGFREAPDGSDFDVVVGTTISASIFEEVRQVFLEGLQGLHLNVSSLGPFYSWPQRECCGIDYDMMLLHARFITMDVDWLAYEYWSGYAGESYWNLPQFANASYDSWRDQLLHSTDYDEVYEAATEMQRILLYQCPVIVLYENVFLSAYRTDKFEGQFNEVDDGIPGWWTKFKVHLKPSQGGPFGGVFRLSNSMDIDTFNFMTTQSRYTMNVLDQLYDSLIKCDPAGSDLMWLAESYIAETHSDNPVVPDGHTRFVFKLIRNASWTDGSPLTADDVSFTLNFYREAPGNPYGADLGDMTAAYAPNSYEVVVEFATESYWHLHTVGYKPIIPEHVFESIGAANWNISGPQPPAQEMVTSGPFNVSEHVQGQFCEQAYNPYYFYRCRVVDPGPDARNQTTTDGNIQDGIPSFMSQVGSIVFIGSLGVIVGVLILYLLQLKHASVSSRHRVRYPFLNSEEYLLRFHNVERQR